VPTTEIEANEEVVGGFAGLVIAPGSPYASMEGALAAIRLARTKDIPLLATCGGFQHVVLEFARSVLDITDAQHAEYDPYASTLFITPLSCSLAGQRMAVQFLLGTKAATAYSSTSAIERYYCNFGLNPAYRDELSAAGLVVTGVDQDDEVRIIELPTRRFFLATLFVPQTSSRADLPHPLLTALVMAAVSR
jgi:CTP synthase (UTP-ammonia lyase)